MPYNRWAVKPLSLPIAIEYDVQRVPPLDVSMGSRSDSELNPDPISIHRHAVRSFLRNSQSQEGAL